MTAAERLYSRLVRRDADAESALDPTVRTDLPANGVRLVTAQALQSAGDQTVNASTVLTWLFHALGVPVGLAGLLVPIRESGSLLPQVFLTPLVMRVRGRRHVFAAGAGVQAAAVAAMALTAAVGTGLTAGVVILAALAVAALGRCLCSIASKDVQGRTVPKGERGQITGVSTMVAGVVALTLGLGIRLLGGDAPGTGVLAALLGLGAALWTASALVYGRVREPEPPAPTADDDGAPDVAARLTSAFRDDPQFRRFVTARSLLLVSALSPPFILALALAAGTSGLSGLGGFILASGLAALLGGRVFGRLADRSSRLLMTGTALAASLVLLTLLGVIALAGGPAAMGPGPATEALFVGAYFLIALIHTGVRVGRKTYVQDMAEGDRRTLYVAAGNTTLGVVLLVVGGISSALAAVDPQWAVLFLALLGLAGVVTSWSLPEVSRG